MRQDKKIDYSEVKYLQYIQNIIIIGTLFLIIVWETYINQFFIKSDYFPLWNIIFSVSILTVLIFSISFIHNKGINKVQNNHIQKIINQFQLTPLPEKVPEIIQEEHSRIKHKIGIFYQNLMVNQDKEIVHLCVNHDFFEVKKLGLKLL